MLTSLRRYVPDSGVGSGNAGSRFKIGKMVLRHVKAQKKKSANVDSDT